MAKVRKRTKAFMVADYETERTTLWCLCGRTYVFNGILTVKDGRHMKNQIPCHCLGEGLVDLEKLVKGASFNPVPGIEVSDVSIDSTVSSHVETAPYSISRKTVTYTYSYERKRRTLAENTVTSGITIKNVPGQTPKILKWQRGDNSKDDIKDVTYIGGAQNLNNEFIVSAWNHLRPDTTNANYGTKHPNNGVDLIYHLALPAIARVGELTSVSDRFYRDNNSRAHMNPDEHLLNTLITKGDIIDTSSPVSFVQVVTGVKDARVEVSALNSRLSWPTIHFAGYALKKDGVDPVILCTSIKDDSDYWTFYDQMLSDRIMSNYMHDLWDFFKYLKTKLTPQQILKLIKSYTNGTSVNGVGLRSTAILSRRLYDLLVRYRRIANNERAMAVLLGAEFKPEELVDGNMVDALVNEAFRLILPSDTRDVLDKAEEVIQETQALLARQKRVSSTSVSKKK